MKPQAYSLTEPIKPPVLFAAMKHRIHLPPKGSGLDSDAEIPDRWDLRLKVGCRVETLGPLRFCLIKQGLSGL